MVTFKTPKESYARMIEIAFPNDANPLGTVFGGKVLNLIDICGTITATRHCRRAVVTASIDNVNFRQPIFVGEWIILESWVNYTGRTSMEVQVEVYAENPLEGSRRHCCTAFLTYVALDERRKPVPIPRLVPETDEEKARWKEAEERRRWRLSRIKNVTRS